ncbi:MAG: hypothetical protein JWR74_715 [Polaromonas sp.]|nr:hypothetical protein [Polaromonas sp.]
MTSSDTHPVPNATSLTDEMGFQQVEAARYAVLRRLAPCLRHHMVRPLQPIGLIYGVLHHKLSVAEPDLQSVRHEAEKINDFAKSALEECMDMGTWLAPEAGVLVAVDSGVQASVGLMASMLHFCGYRLVNAVEDLPVQVQRDALRMVLGATLFALTDAMDEPATLTLSAEAGPTHVTIAVQIEREAQGQVDSYDDGYRKLVWGDVQALARADQVGLSRQDNQVTLRFAIGEAPAS